MGLQTKLEEQWTGQGWDNSSLKTPPPRATESIRVSLSCYNYRLMHHCMTLTFSNTVFENCDSILVLFTDYTSLDKNDVRYIMEVTHMLS